MWRIGNGMLNCSPWFGILCIAGSPFCQKFRAQLMQFLVFFKGLDAMVGAMLFSAVSERHIKKSFKKWTKGSSLSQKCDDDATICIL